MFGPCGLEIGLQLKATEIVRPVLMGAYVLSTFFWVPGCINDSILGICAIINSVTGNLTPVKAIPRADRNE